jgi:hypothetical protein
MAQRPRGPDPGLPEHRPPSFQKSGFCKIRPPCPQTAPEPLPRPRPPRPVAPKPPHRPPEARPVKPSQHPPRLARPGSAAPSPWVNVMVATTTTIFCTGCHNHDKRGAGRQQRLRCEWRLGLEWYSGARAGPGGAQDWAGQARKLHRKDPKAVPVRPETGSAQAPTSANEIPKPAPVKAGNGPGRALYWARGGPGGRPPEGIAVLGAADQRSPSIMTCSDNSRTVPVKAGTGPGGRCTGLVGVRGVAPRKESRPTSQVANGHQAP